jgi:hypothetical protein
LTQTPLQSLKPLLQTMPQVPPIQLALPLLGVGQTLLQPPQLLGSVFSLTHAPPQLEKPTAQLMPQAPEVQTAVELATAWH